jgi:2-polyprenyl-3-methyl-5-hydroxy-6-metoxy-1,4-benzoquinol methylase
MNETASPDYNYDSIDSGYYDRVYHRNQGSQSKWHHLKFDHVQRHMPEDYESHLDIASGPGTFVGTLPTDRPSTGVDIAQPQIDYAQKHYGTDHHQFQLMEPGSLPFPEASFQVVTLIELIEHLEMGEIEQLLGEVKRVLKPGGKIILTTPNYRSGWPILEKIVNRVAEVSYEDQHITFFHRRRLEKLLQTCEFENSKATTFQGIAPFSASISWNLGNWIQPIENFLLQPALGFLLLGEGMKPE